MVEEKRPLAVDMRKITKKFGDFTANDQIDLQVEKGEIHALLGENGAGKSTLMNVLYGLYKPTSGQVLINGETAEFTSPRDAIAKGLGMVHQHFMLINPFTVMENIILGEEPVKGLFLDLNQAKKEALALSDQYGLRVDVEAKIEDISVGMQQRVEILKALYRKAEILILDEPTAVLTPQEIEEIIEILRNLASQGKTIIIITHKLDEVKALADRCTIIRNGQKIQTVDTDQVTEADLAEMMVGRSVKFQVDRDQQEPGEEILHIENLHVKDVRGLDAVDGLNLSLHKGEILGIAGVDGNGQSELIEALTGLREVASGQILLQGTDISKSTPKKIRQLGLKNIPADRNRRGLVGEFTIAENLILELYDQAPYAKGGLLQKSPILSHAEDLMEKYDIRPRRPEYFARSLSGGNQQKVILAREIDADPEVLIAAQPTRGLDVGAIEYIHSFLVEQRNKGRAILLISFELDEIMSLSDRVAVIFEGNITAEFKASEFDEKTLGYHMAGGGKNA
ncbi:MAG: ABC transporter ATP-binding protein [Tissierellia bacterium]|nr:ABC transporter ATP-binding protein [Tissierellia bacterium]